LLGAVKGARRRHRPSAATAVSALAAVAVHGAGTQGMGFLQRNEREKR
jgi:hypothetical protein